MASAVRRAERVPTHTIMLEIPYPLLERVRRLVTAQQGQLLDEDFTANVVVTARFPVEHLPGFQAAPSELSNGSAQVELIESGEVLIPLPEQVT